MRIIAVANQKGGCGKTTTAINLSSCLAFLQKKILLIDLDPQGHATCGLGVKAEFLDRTAYSLFEDETASMNDLIVPVNDHLSLVPSYVVLSEAEHSAAFDSDHWGIVKNHLEKLSEPYEYVVIDSPPNLGMLTFNALTAADEVIIPIEPSFFSLHGLAKIFETIDSLDKLRSKRLKIHALMTRFEKRTRLAREVREEVQKHFRDQMFVHNIDESVRLREAAASGRSIVDFDRDSTGFRSYMGLAIEVIERGLLLTGIETGHEAWVKSSGAASLKVSAKQPAASEKVLEIAAQSSNEKSEPLRAKKVLGGILFSFVCPSANSVMIAGDFNRWIAEPLVRTDDRLGLWQIVIPLTQGVYHYKFLVDDVWCADPFNERTAQNSYGGVDSVITVDNLPPAHEDYKEKANAGTA